MGATHFLIKTLPKVAAEMASPSGQAALLVKKVVQIFREADVVFVVRPVDENHPKIAALVNEFGRDAVLGALAEVTKIWKEVFEEDLTQVALDEAHATLACRLN